MGAFKLPLLAQDSVEHLSISLALPPHLTRKVSSANNGIQMHIGLLADTHIREAAQRLPPQVAEAFRGVDLILHAGDIYIPSVLDELERIAPVFAACGDDDYGAILTDRRVKPKYILRLEGQTLWLVHDSAYYYLLKSRQASNPVGQTDADAPDIVVFGHTHYSIVEHHNGILFVNPSSPMFVNNCWVPGTVAILHINSGKAEANMLQL